MGGGGKTLREKQEKIEQQFPASCKCTDLANMAPINVVST